MHTIWEGGGWAAMRCLRLRMFNTYVWSPASSLRAIAAVRCIGDGFGAILTSWLPSFEIAAIWFLNKGWFALTTLVASHLPPTFMKEIGVASLSDFKLDLICREGFERFGGKMWFLRRQWVCGRKKQESLVRDVHLLRNTEGKRSFVNLKSKYSLFPRWSHNFSQRDFPQTKPSY